jgi:hypothetical protein
MTVQSNKPVNDKNTNTNTKLASIHKQTRIFGLTLRLYIYIYI